MYISDINDTILDLGLPDTIYVAQKLDLILIKDIPALNNIQVIVNPVRYKRNTVTLRFKSRTLVFDEKPEPKAKPKK